MHMYVYCEIRPIKLEYSNALRCWLLISVGILLKLTVTLSMCLVSMQQQFIRPPIAAVIMLMETRQQKQQKLHDTTHRRLHRNLAAPPSQLAQSGPTDIASNCHHQQRQRRPAIPFFDL